MNVVTTPKRSQLMGMVGRENTAPELEVRRFLHGLGFRFRLHRADLPGKPDIVLSRFRTVVFVHGCFWHRHANCAKTTTPVANREFWLSKFKANQSRDKRNYSALRRLGWKVFVIWECESKSPTLMKQRLRRLLTGIVQ